MQHVLPGTMVGMVGIPVCTTRYHGGYTSLPGIYTLYYPGYTSIRPGPAHRAGQWCIMLRCVATRPWAQQ